MDAQCEVRLRDNANPGVAVRAVLHSDFPAARLDEVEAARSAVRATGTAEHAHWDWRNKADPRVLQWFRLMAIEYEGVQALMAVVKEPIGSRLASGERVVYVSVIEVAPWNLSLYTAAPRSSGCGSRLLGAAVRLSEELGCSGRVGLHSLPQAETYYNRCGLIRVGADVENGRLVYYEFDPTTAERFLVDFG